MCGRFNLTATKPQIMTHFSLQLLPDYDPDYNNPLHNDAACLADVT
jgi:putative SOS response-associated peptidase YedK